MTFFARRATATACSALLALSIAAPSAMAAPKGLTNEPNPLTPGQVRSLQRDGINISSANVESRGGYTFLQDGSRWAIIHSGSSTGKSDIDAGICTGSFFTPAMVAGKIEWGASDSCKSTAAPNDLYQHYITVNLRQGNTDVMTLGRMYSKRWATSPNSRYSRVASVHVTLSCDNTTKHHFDVVVYVTVHSIQFAPHVSNNPILACGLKDA